MKHRSVIAFVIVAAALFSLPQLSHDLQALKGEVGARLHRELLHAFLNLPAGEPTASAPAVARPAEMLLASCTKEKSGAAATRVGKVKAGGNIEGRFHGKSFEQSAMIGDPASDPINNVARVDVKEIEDALAAMKVETEVAMIVPPETGFDPRPLMSTLTASDVARVKADTLRGEADRLRVAYAKEARFEANGPEWQKAVEDAARKLNSSVPGVYEFRVVRNGAKTRVLKFNCNECPATAPRPQRAPRQAPPVAPQPAPSTPAEWSAGE